MSGINTAPKLSANEAAERIEKGREKISRAASEVAAGRTWRAKEILRGCIGSLDYGLNREVLAAYGELLEQLGERCEAGKYLFLSGSTNPDHRDAIQIYLHRNRRASAADLVAQFPAAIRHLGLGNLPSSIRSELEKRGLDQSELQRTEPQQDEFCQRTWRGSVVAFLAIGLMILSVLFWGLGLVTCIRWVWSLFG